MAFYSWSKDAVDYLVNPSRDDSIPGGTTYRNAIARLRIFGAVLSILCLWTLAGTLFWYSNPTDESASDSSVDTERQAATDEYWQIILRGIASTLVVAPVVAAVYETVQRFSSVEQSRAEMAGAMRSYQPILDRLLSSGIDDAYRTMPSHLIAKYINNARSEIVLLNTWMPDSALLRDSLLAAHDRGVKIRILFVDPESSIAQTRNSDLQYGPGQMYHNVIRTWTELALRLDFIPFPGEGYRSVIDEEVFIEGTREERPQRNDAETSGLKFYDSMPSIPIYGVDGRFFIGVFWHSKQGVEGTSVAVEETGFLGNDIQKHFENIWRDSIDAQEVADRPRKAQSSDCGSYRHLFYSSATEDGESIWRYVKVDIRKLVHTKESQSFSPKEKEGVEYRFEAEQQADQLICHYTGVKGQSDHGVFAFPISGREAEFSSQIAGIQSHIDWGGQPAIGAVLMMTDEGVGVLASKELGINCLGSGQLIESSDAVSELREQWLSSPPVKRDLSAIIS